MTDALLVNGTDLRSLGRVMADFGGALGGAPTVRNNADVVPRRQGSVATDSILGSQVLSVRMTLLGNTGTSYTRAQYHTVATALRKLVFNNGKAFTLTRTRDLTAGTQTHVATARYLRGLESPEQIAAHGGRVTFELEVFDGLWYDSAQTIVSPGTISVGGEAITRKIVLDLQTAGTLNNTTLGISVTVAEAAVLTVESFTTAGGNIATMSWSPADGYWFALAPGSNAITWSGGGATTIAYQAAWL